MKADKSALGTDRTAARESAGQVLRVLREQGPATRAELALATGLGRSTVAQRLEALLQHRLVVASGNGASTGGRRPVTLGFNREAGVVLAADLGATHARLAVLDLAGTTLAEEADELAIAAGPDVVLGWVEERFAALLASAGRSAESVRGLGLGVPGPVEFASARPVSPPIMPGWDGYDVRGRLRSGFAVPLLLDNDVNIMALGEHTDAHDDVDDLLFVKVGTGIGCGIVAGGAIYRGAQGAAGDIGHIRVTGHDDAICHCANAGCLEAVAGGGALARRLADLGLPASNGRDVVDLVRAGNPDAVRLLREAGRLLGEVLAHSVNLLNPAVIVIGGDLAAAQGHLLAGVREIVYQRSLPLATRHLRITTSSLGDRAGVRGAGAMILEHVLSPEVVDAQLAGG